MSQAAKQMEQAVGRLQSVVDGAHAAQPRQPRITGAFSADALRLDTEAEIRRIAAAVREQIQRRLRRRGAVVGLSGGIDSSVCAALCVEALGPKNVLAVLMPEKDSESDSLRLGRHDGRGARHRACGGKHRPDAHRRRLLRAARRMYPPPGAGIRPRLGLQGGDRQSAGRRGLQPDHAGGAVAGRRAAEAAHAARRLSRHRRRHQHEAAHPQADRVLPRRPAELRGDRHAEPAGIRPGLLCEERRRRRRRQADRASLQEPGLHAGRGARRAGGNPPPAADHRHLVAGAVAGGVLLLAAVPRDGPLPVRPQQRRAFRRRRRRPRG